MISPDNKSVAYVSDESGEYALHVRSLENNSVKKIRIEEKPSFYWDLVWSPDSSKLAFPYRRLGFWLVDVTAETATRVDSSTYSAQQSWAASFSPDSRFLAYSKRMKNRAGAVFIYDLAQKKAFQVTDGVTHAESPAFDRNGKYLYFVSSLNAGTSEFGWGVLNGIFANPLVVRRLHAAVLSKDQPSLLLPNGQPNPDAKVGDVVPQVKIDFERLGSRVVNLPLPQRDYAQFVVGQPGKLVMAVREWSAAPGDFGGPTQSQAVYYFDVAKGGQMQKIVDQINAVDLTADGNARTYTVFPALGENRLRRANWAEENRKRVEQLSGGRLGYIFIEGYGGDGIMNAIRGLTGYADKQGIIIDQRFNGGGITPDYLIEWMQRKPLYYYMFRGGDDIATPVNPAPPVKVMIINELNGSAAETGAFMFKLAKVGPLVGKRTFGGGIGPYYFTPSLIDGGQIRLPNRAAYDPSGTTWGIENIGVAPDFDVEITPADVIAGRDPQLEKAVEVALAQLSKNPVIVPKRPVFPVHPGEQNKVQSVVSIASLPQPGSAFPAPAAKPTQTAGVPDGKFAAFVGNYDGGTMGVLVIRQEADKLIAIDPGGGRVELVPEATADTFTPAVGGKVSFERDAGGKVTGIVVTLPNGQTIKGRKV